MCVCVRKVLSCKKNPLPCSSQQLSRVRKSKMQPWPLPFCCGKQSYLEGQHLLCSACSSFCVDLLRFPGEISEMASRVQS